MTTLEVGHTLDPIVVGPITRTTLALFAGGSGDHNPIHIDLDVAKSAGLDDVFAPGMLSMAYLSRLITDNFPIESIRRYAVRFIAITPVLAEPTCTGRVTDIQDTDGERLATLELVITLADGTKTLVGDAVVAL
jgi:acyl dehydratase